MRWCSGSGFRLLLAAGLAVGLMVSADGQAEAHGRDVVVTLTCQPSDPAAPLDLVCQASVRYVGDLDPVGDARLTLNAVRSGGEGEQVSGGLLQPAGQPGVYSARLSLPAYGRWAISAMVEAPASGSVTVQQMVLPPALAAPDRGVAGARLAAGFGVQDLLNLGALLAHVMATLALFAANGLVLIGAVLEREVRFRRAVARWVPWLVAGSLAAGDAQWPSQRDVQRPYPGTGPVAAGHDRGAAVGESLLGDVCG